jgi:hypothetical protein
MAGCDGRHQTLWKTELIPRFPHQDVQQSKGCLRQAYGITMLAAKYES